jgi:hypothetical protein
LFQEVLPPMENTFALICSSYFFLQKYSAVLSSTICTSPYAYKNTELHFIKGEAHFPHEGTPDEMSNIINNWLK